MSCWAASSQARSGVPRRRLAGRREDLGRCFRERPACDKAHRETNYRVCDQAWQDEVGAADQAPECPHHEGEAERCELVAARVSGAVAVDVGGREKKRADREPDAE
jgi:hypothetical protein